MQEKYKPLIRPLLVSIALVCLSVAGMALLGEIADLDLAVLLGNPLMAMGLLLELLALLLFVGAWKLLVRIQLGPVLSLVEAGAHIGVTLLGKYIPGKIWGLVGRAYLLKTHSIKIGGSIGALLLDQLLTFSSGILVSGVFLGLLFDVRLTLIGLALALTIQHLLLDIYPALAEKVTWLVARPFSQRGESLDPIVLARVSRPGFYSLQLLYVGHWLLTALALACLVYPLIRDDFGSATLLICAAVPAAMLSGFLALWAPGGIGVREVVIVAILAIQLPVEIGLTVALVYRVMSVLVDLLLGALAMVFFSRQGFPGLGGGNSP